MRCVQPAAQSDLFRKEIRDCRCGIDEVRNGEHAPDLGLELPKRARKIENAGTKHEPIVITDDKNGSIPWRRTVARKVAMRKLACR